MINLCKTCKLQTKQLLHKIMRKINHFMPKLLYLFFYSDVCANGNVVTFELITGQVFTAPSDTVTMLPGILHLTECLQWCLTNDTCKSVNFETGLCVLLSSSAIERPEALTPSQFPVFTTYAQKVCLKGIYRQNIRISINHWLKKQKQIAKNDVILIHFHSGK